MKLSALLLSSALTLGVLNGCQSAPAAKQSIDLVTEIKKHPDFLREFLDGHSGIENMMTIKSNYYVAYYDFEGKDLNGKDDELIISANYIIVPIIGNHGVPILTEYTVFDVNEQTSFIYVVRSGISFASNSDAFDGQVQATKQWNIT